MTPFGSFFIIHLETGGDTKSLQSQEAYWPVLVEIINLADRYAAKLTLHFNPQWIEYIMQERIKLAEIRKWQAMGHEMGLHHHGYDHDDWNGYTNRSDKESEPGFRGNVQDMIQLAGRFFDPGQPLSGTITDEEFDYPASIKYDTQGIKLCHARRKPKLVTLNSDTEMIQLGMALLTWKRDIENFKKEYMKSEKDELFGVVTHEYDFAKNPVIIEKWLEFVYTTGVNIQTVSEIIAEYRQVYSMEHTDKPLTFKNDIKAKIPPAVSKCV